MSAGVLLEMSTGLLSMLNLKNEQSALKDVVLPTVLHTTKLPPTIIARSDSGRLSINEPDGNLLLDANAGGSISANSLVHQASKTHTGKRSFVALNATMYIVPPVKQSSMCASRFASVNTADRDGFIIYPGFTNSALSVAAGQLDTSSTPRVATAIDCYLPSLSTAANADSDTWAAVGSTGSSCTLGGQSTMAIIQVHSL